MVDIKDIEKWFKIAKPEPTIDDACVQIGCHYEEVKEMMDAVGDIDPYISNLSNKYKERQQKHVLNIFSKNKKQQIELLDALCDQIVTAVGVGYMMGFDMQAALNEVNNSNFSKFENGKAVLNCQGKIKKGINYFNPKLDKCIDRDNK